MHDQRVGQRGWGRHPPVPRSSFPRARPRTRPWRTLPTSRHDPPPFRLNRIHGANNSCASALSPDACNQFQHTAPAYRTASYKHRFFNLRLRPSRNCRDASADPRCRCSNYSHHFYSYCSNNNNTNSNSNNNTITDLATVRRTASLNPRTETPIPKFVLLSGEGTQFHKRCIQFIDPVFSTPLGDTWDIHNCGRGEKGSLQYKHSTVRYGKVPPNLCRRHILHSVMPRSNGHSRPDTLPPCEELVALREALRYMEYKCSTVGYQKYFSL